MPKHLVRAGVHAWECTLGEITTVKFFASEEDAYKYGFDDGCDEVARSPKFDEYWPQGKVPTKELIKHGWVICCGMCGEDASAGNGLGYIGFYEDSVFCSPTCRAEYVELMRLRRKQYSQVLAYLRSNFKGVSSASIYMKSRYRETSACFRQGDRYYIWTHGAGVKDIGPVNKGKKDETTK